jgi:hypothetical protein
MRVGEIIRELLNQLDQIEQSAEIQPQGDDVNRFKHVDELTKDPEFDVDYSNTPNEQYADINAVTRDAGGGMNGPKHPADIRGSTQAMYPGTVYGAR